MRISDWSSDVCSSDLDEKAGGTGEAPGKGAPSPMTAAQVKASDDKAKAAPPPTPKTTAQPLDTDPGAKANLTAATQSPAGAKAHTTPKAKNTPTKKEETSTTKPRPPHTQKKRQN